MWSFLADGNFTVDEETQKQAQADIAEDGYWGVEQTSDPVSYTPLDVYKRQVV